jgi:hypothetical protein
MVVPGRGSVRTAYRSSPHEAGGVVIDMVMPAPGIAGRGVSDEEQARTTLIRGRATSPTAAIVRDVCVGRPTYAEQLPAPLGELVDGVPEPRGAVAAYDGRLAGALVGQPSGQLVVLDGQRATTGSGDLPRLPARGGGQPAADGGGVDDAAWPPTSPGRTVAAPPIVTLASARLVEGTVLGRVTTVRSALHAA